MVVFRSVTVPLKAAVMNLLSIGGAYGVVVAVFQWGWLGGLFGLDETIRFVSFFPTLFFAVLFGLSMDYEVFLVSRIREAYDATGDNTEAVARGLASTSRVITSGALIMICVFLGFVTNPDPSTKMIGARSGRRDRHRRDPRPDGPGPRDHGAHGPGQLVAPRLARPASAAPRPRERRQPRPPGDRAGAEPEPGRAGPR